MNSIGNREENLTALAMNGRHPHWMLLGFDPDSAALHNALWPLVSPKSFARRRIYDARLTLSVFRRGVTAFATANVKDFEEFGFNRVWNPVEIGR